MSTNQYRASRFGDMVANYGDDSPDANLIDLLTDAQHWCDHTGEDFHVALAQACRHYVNELNNQQLDERRLP